MNLVDVVRKLWNNDGRDRPWGYVMPVTIVTAGNLDEEDGDTVGGSVPVRQVDTNGNPQDFVPGGQYKNITFHSAAIATANGVTLGVTGSNSGALSVVGIQITGISGDTITFEVNIDGTNWLGILAENVTTGAEATTATANGVYRITCLGMVQLRARLTRSAGTVTVTGVCVP